MELSNKIKSRMEAATRNFKCPICGNQQIYLSSELSVKPFFKFGGEFSNPDEVINAVTGQCACCGYMMDFNIGILMKGDHPK